MLKQVKIENFKSVKKVDVKVGRFNVIIGENGAGKSNFLEALAVYSAIETEKFDHEFLANRGIRYSEPKLLVSLFDEDHNHFSIEVTEKYSNTIQKATVSLSDDVLELSESNIKLERIKNSINKENNNEDNTTIKITFSKKLEQFFKDIETKSESDSESSQKKSDVLKKILESMSFNERENFLDDIKVEVIKNKILDKFLIYSPENSALKDLVKDGQILPLGINGEGLFKQIQRIKNEYSTELENKTVYANSFKDIIECASKFDWVESIDVSDSTNPLDHKITITDQYLVSELDQRSANEGFLFVLFYATLFCSKNTPKIFAVDNIDASLNPKMCKVLIEILIEFSKKYDKQVFVTTHNPAILDGLNLYDDEQALFVVSRNSDGHTKLKRLNRDNLPKEIIDSKEALRLSEAFIRGYLGGLPRNF